jgi:hypothetical protein
VAPAAQMASEVANAQPSMLRSVYADSQINVGVMPADNQACVLAVTSVGTSGACMNLPDTYVTGLTVGFNDPGQYHLAGVLPSGALGIAVVTQDGVTHNLALSANNGFAFAGTVPPVSLVYTDGSGTNHVSALPATAGPPQMATPVAGPLPANPG